MILLRHGESEFNVVYRATRIDPGIRDPRLTETGRRQAADAARALDGRRLQRLVTSPYTRALETATIVAEALDLPVTIEPLVRERRVFACDIGTLRSRLADRWPAFSFDHLDEEWWPGVEESETKLHARCRRFRRTAVAWSDHGDVVVVTHWAFIRALTGLSVANADVIAYHPHEPNGVVCPDGPC